jgi:hypothetical protein
VLCLQVASIQQERQGTEGLVAELGKQSAALEAWLASHEWKADAVSAALAQGSSEAGALDINKVIVPAGGSMRRVSVAVALGIWFLWGVNNVYASRFSQGRALI